MSNNKKLIKSINDACVIFCIFLFLIIFIEASLYFTFLLKDNHLKSIDRRSVADTYDNAPWTEDYFKELRESSFDVRWMPHVYWRRNPYDGEYVNVAHDGLRLTPNSVTNSTGSSPKPEIFLFGGSTMWGTGARDSFAIPALLLQELKKRGINANVRNFGESGYVSAQELAMLMHQLRNGDIPNIVIFYDGVNDVFSAYQQGTAGIPQNEIGRTREFNLTKPIRRQDLIDEPLEASSTMRFIRILVGAPDSNNQTISDQDHMELAQDVISTYANNVRMAHALAEYYGFKTLFYWQPTVFEKKILTDYEKGELERVNSEQRSFFDMTYNLIRDEGELFPTSILFHNLSEVFSDTHEPIYIDWMHLGERGNSIIAQRIVDDVNRIIEALPQTGGEQTSEHRLSRTR
ncbi:MAG: SGNH/GDSL hydrolase family protein [Geminicoccaceae bacterium]